MGDENCPVQRFYSYPAAQMYFLKEEHYEGVDEAGVRRSSFEWKLQRTRDYLQIRGGDTVKKEIRTLWIKGLRGSGEAYRRLGIIFLTGTCCQKDRTLARLCLKQSAELGSEEGYFLYHNMFSKGKKVIDDASYESMWQAYGKEKNWRKRKRIKRYLELGTNRQKRAMIRKGAGNK